MLKKFIKQLLAAIVILVAGLSATSAENYVLFKNPDGWANPCVWAWTNSANCCANGSWPGDSMTKLANGYWRWDLPAGKPMPTSIIFSNHGSPQSGNLTYTDKGVYNTKNNTSTVDTDGSLGRGETPQGGGGEEGDDDYPAMLYMLGTINSTNWSSTTAGATATKTAGSTKYTFTDVVVHGDTSGYGFFVFSSEIGSWDSINSHRYEPEEANELVATGNTYTLSTVHNDYAFKIAAGTYTFTVDLATNKVSITGEADEPPVIDPDEYPAKMYIVGTVNSSAWSETTAAATATRDADSATYTFRDVTVDSNAQGYGFFIFSTDIGTWDKINSNRYEPASKDMPVTTDHTYSIFHSNHDYAFKIAAGKYDFVVDLAAATVTITGESITPPDPDPDPEYDPSYPATLYMIGTTAGTWSVPNALASAPQQAGAVYNFKNVAISGSDGLGYFTFTSKTGNWTDIASTRYNPKDGDVEASVGEAVPLKKSSDGSFHIADGTYNVTVNLRNMTATITSFVEIDPDEPGDPNGSIGSITSWSEDEATGDVNFTGSAGTLRITPYGTGSVRVLARPRGMATDTRASIAVVGTPSRFDGISESDQDVVMTLGNLSVHVSKANSGVSFVGDDGTVYFSENGGMTNTIGSITGSFYAPGTKAFYGGGYYSEFNQVGKTLVMDNKQTGRWPDGDGSYNHNITIPFVVSHRGFGILFDDVYRGSSIHPGRGSLTYNSSAQNPVAYYYVHGDGTMAGTLENYTELTGRQPMPPYWALGYITSRFSYGSETEAWSYINKIKNNSRLPLDGIVFDLYWEGNKDLSPNEERNAGMGNMTWVSQHFPDPEKMMNDFRAKGVHTICITEPFFSTKCSNYQELINRGYSADNNVSGMEWIRGGALIDATNPAALDWFWSLYHPRTAEGIDSWWLDLGEPEQHDADSHHMGGSVSQVHNEFGNLWVERVARGLREDFPTKRYMVMPRAGTAGMQRFGSFPWTGDIYRSWNGLAVQVPALLSSGMSGVAYMGSDVGGFIHDQNHYVNGNLYTRWCEFSTFAPTFRTHSTDFLLNGEPIIESGYSAAQIAIVRDMLNRRYSYLPYTYTLSYENSTSGAPMARPICYYDADNSSILSVKDQYLWGHDILVAPVLTDGNSRAITFPEEGSRWYDLNNPGMVYEGGTTISGYQATLEVLPHFARAGSIIPRFTADEYTSTSDIDHSKLTLQIFAGTGDHATGQYYDDNHDDISSIENNRYRMLKFDFNDTTELPRLFISSEGEGFEGEPATRDLVFDFPVLDIEASMVSTMQNGVYTEFHKCQSSDEFEGYTAGPSFYVVAPAASGPRRAPGTSTTPSLKVRIPAWDGSVSYFSLHDKTVTDVELTERIEAGVRVFVADATAGRITVGYHFNTDMNSARIALYDIHGRLIDTADVETSAGTHTIDMACGTPGSVYIVRLDADSDIAGTVSDTARAMVH